MIAALLAALIAAPEPGVYSAPAPDHVGSLIVELYPDRTAIVRRVVSVHLPPAELETLRVAIDREGCWAPAPRTLDRCLIEQRARELVVVSLPGKEKVTLTWRAAVEGATAPSAKPKS